MSLCSPGGCLGAACSLRGAWPGEVAGNRRSVASAVDKATRRKDAPGPEDPRVEAVFSDAQDGEF